MKAMSKSEIARKAGVNRKTLARWLKRDKTYLEKHGVDKNQRVLQPNVVKYILEKYCI